MFTYFSHKAFKKLKGQTIGKVAWQILPFFSYPEICIIVPESLFWRVFNAVGESAKVRLGENELDLILLPPSDTIPEEELLPSQSWQDIASKVLENPVIATVSSLLNFKVGQRKTFKVGDEIGVQDFVKSLEELGYEPGFIPNEKTFVASGAKVEFGVGDDVIRVAFFGDEIDDIAVFSEGEIKGIDKIAVSSTGIDFDWGKWKAAESVWMKKDMVVFEPQQVSRDLMRANVAFGNDVFLESVEEKLLTTDSRVLDAVFFTQESADLDLEIKFVDKAFDEAKLDEINQVARASFSGRWIAGDKVLVEPIKVRKKGFLKDVFDLKPGELVVHEDVGIGVFEKIENDGFKDYIVFKYKTGPGPDQWGRFYLPIERTTKLHRYNVLADEAQVDFTTVRTWKKRLKRVKEDIFKYAKKLIDMYARRHVAKGVSFSAAELEDEFVRDFKFVDTPDQSAAWEFIKDKLENPEPAEILLCGEVGFGKTEIIMRAAFKVVLAGYQVAVLVPTQTLAWQHEKTFKERMEKWGVIVERLTGGGAKKLKRAIEEGKVDVVIGTTSLLNIKFKKLGLWIVDEEHKFGVFQKEKIKENFPNVDIIYVSATPIPRTLQMALSGIRDIVLLESPPPGRKPVRTFVMKYSWHRVMEAVRAELRRGGRIFCVLPTIKEAKFYKRLFEKEHLRVAIATGEDKRRTQEAIDKLIKGEIDVLVATTVIESGMDIPVVNTMIVIGAERFGLAQLYQLRGRVGRADVQAYAYFFYKSLVGKAQERLLALKELKLGQNLELALKDLRIRGAGNVLGKKQHGHISAIGFSLYQKLLSEAIERLKGQEWSIPEVELHMAIDTDYFSSLALKMHYLKKLSDVKSIDELREVVNEMMILGKPRGSVLRLIMLHALKVLIARYGVELIKGFENGVEVYPANDTKVADLITTGEIKGLFRVEKDKVWFSWETVARYTSSLLKTILDEEVIMNLL